MIYVAAVLAILFAVRTLIALREVRGKAARRPYLGYRLWSGALIVLVAMVGIIDHIWHP